MASMNQGGRASAGAILTKPQAHVCSGSKHEVAALQPAAREQEPRGRQPS